MLSDQAHRMRAFNHVLGNTAAAMLATTFLWFGITFWAYLETRSVLATSIMGGAYMLGMAILGVPFGSLIDRYRKHVVMVWSAVGTAVLFLLAGAVFILTPRDTLVDLGGPWFWVFTGLALGGALLAMPRGLALSTCVTMLVESDRRANANGLVGAVNGMTMLVTGVLSGLAYGQLGMVWVVAIALVVILASLVHLLLIRIPEPTIVHADGTPKPVDFKAAWLAIVAVPGLFGLILFSTLNNFLGGVFMGLLDPYGLELMSVEAWGILFGLSSIGFIVGGSLIAKWGLGAKPLRTLLLGATAMWLVSFGFTLRESVVALAIGIFAYMVIVPFMEASEQTLLQRVVPLAKQGRVFGFAQAVEMSAAPLSAFVIGPVAEFWLIPYAESPQGRTDWGWLLGEGNARGIALVFVLFSIAGLLVTGAAFFTRTYRLLNVSYAAGDVNEGVAESTDDGPPGPNPLGRGFAEH
ncbi:MFS transporter [Tessaracoccus sp. MC1679]|uniref:MFS transporter n=1 Tax=Tessaracoccus sp. MC1679 TaxID=2760313 RepID=UPI00351BF153